MTTGDWVSFAVVVLFGVGTIAALAATAYQERRVQMVCGNCSHLRHRPQHIRCGLTGSTVNQQDAGCFFWDQAKEVK